MHAVGSARHSSSERPAPQRSSVTPSAARISSATSARHALRCASAKKGIYAGLEPKNSPLFLRARRRQFSTRAPSNREEQLDRWYGRVDGVDGGEATLASL